MMLPYGLDSVPIRAEGETEFVVAREIPKPFAAQFVLDMAHLSQVGMIERFAAEVIFHANDWIDWASGKAEWGFPEFEFDEAKMKLPYDLDKVQIQLGDDFDFVRLTDIPQPFRSQFKAAMYGQGQPYLEGRTDLFYAWDWQEWASGYWRWGGKPEPA